MIEHLIIGIAFCAQAGMAYALWCVSGAIKPSVTALNPLHLLCRHNWHLWSRIIHYIAAQALVTGYAACAIIGIETVKRWLLGLLQ